MDIVENAAHEKGVFTAVALAHTIEAMPRILLLYIYASHHLGMQCTYSLNHTPTPQNDTPDRPQRATLPPVVRSVCNRPISKPLTPYESKALLGAYAFQQFTCAHTGPWNVAYKVPK